MRTILFLSAFLMASALSAQVSFNTGDTELDNDLIAINDQAKLDLPAFKADLSATFGVTTKNIDYMISINMEPAEMYFALEISVAVGKPIEEVIDMYEANRTKGWGYIAQQMGIKPGSAEFHALKGKSKAKKEKSSKGSAVNTNSGNGNGKGNGKNSTSKKNK